MTELIFIIVGLVGLVIGSFLNVVIYRVPRQVRFLASRSVCPQCKGQLRWYHNVPVLSYIFLRGRCGFCGVSISARYPLVEILNTLFFVYFYWQCGLSLQFGVFAFLGAVLLCIFFIDLDFQIIPDVITLPGMVIGLGISLLPGGIGIAQASIGLLVGGGVLYLVALFGDFIFKKESMGGGDIKMAAMLGAFLGWQKVVFVFMASACIGLVVSLVLMAFSAKLRQERVVPFGPFLAAAAMVAIIYGDQIIGFYIANFLPGN